MKKNLNLLHVDSMESLMTIIKNVSIRSIKLRFATEALIPELLLRGMNLQESSVLSFETK